MDITLPDARDLFHNFYWLTLKSSHGRNGDPHHSHTAPIHYLTNLQLRDKLKSHMHKRHKLGSADTSGYYYKLAETKLYHTAHFPKHHRQFRSSYPTLSTCQQINQQLLRASWNNSKITFKHQINVLKYRTVQFSLKNMPSDSNCLPPLQAAHYATKWTALITLPLDVFTQQ
eukprot:1147242-Pelagomonas_calceolata.AAC.1